MGLHVGRRKSGSEESIVDDGVSSNEVDHRETKAEVRNEITLAGLKTTERAVIHAMCA
jgi:hypothetical protein